MTDIDLLESVLAKDRVLLAEVSPDQMSHATNCPEYDVAALVNHIVGWLQVFAAGANDRSTDLDAGAYQTQDPVAEFSKAADDVLAGWRAHGTDRTVSLLGGGLPGAAVLGMTLMEYLTHGCDLALATGQAIPFSDLEVETTYERAKTTLPDQYRGPGKPFGDKIEIDESAVIIDRFLGFMGRTGRT